MVHIYAFAPLDLKDGGRRKWDEIGAAVARGFIEDLQKLTTNLQDDNILGIHFKTPLDIQRYNNALVETDIQHIGFYNWQLGGNRPVPGWGQYRTPVAKLYMTGGSTHPGGGVTGGRAAMPPRSSWKILVSTSTRSPSELDDPSGTAVRLAAFDEVGNLFVVPHARLDGRFNIAGKHMIHETLEILFQLQLKNRQRLKSMTVSHVLSVE